MKQLIGCFITGVIQKYRDKNRDGKLGIRCQSNEALGGSCSHRVLHRIEEVIEDPKVSWWQLPWIFWEIYWQEIGDCQGTSGVMGCGPHGTPRPPAPDNNK